MSLSLIALLVWFIGLAAIQFYLTWRILAAHFRRTAHVEEMTSWPPVMAVLCLRGTDPFLPECLKRLTTMDYPNFILRIVIDSFADSARETVEVFLAEKPHRNVEVVYLENRLPHCSGKVSGLLQATEQIPSQCQVVAFFDGDTLVHPTCLRELVAPLRDPKIGITSGNRWYAPQRLNFASLVRYSWNALAVPLMNAVQFPWGGCMAIRASDLRDPALRNHCEMMFNEDATLGSFVLKRGQSVEFVAAATIVNRESTSFQGFSNFLARQLLVARSCYYRWPMMFGQILTLNVSMVFWFLLGAPLPHWNVIVAGLVSVSTILYAEVALLEYLVRKTVAKRGESIPAWQWSSVLLVPIALAVVCAMNLRATSRALRGGLHTWRGITYRFDFGNSDEPSCRVVSVVPVATPYAELIESMELAVQKAA